MGVDVGPRVGCWLALVVEAGPRPSAADEWPSQNALSMGNANAAPGLRLDSANGKTTTAARDEKVWIGLWFEPEPVARFGPRVVR